MKGSKSKRTIIIATRNTHKVREISTILGNSFRYLTLRDLPGAPNVIEDAESFADNASKKALELARWLQQLRSVDFKMQGKTFTTEHVGSATQKLFVLADDSGLEVDALGGKPGIHSARFAALDSGISGNSTDADNNAKLLRLLNICPRDQRTARFRCVMALVRPASELGTLKTELFTGICDGRIDCAPSGNGGFGYDPLFIPQGYNISFAELGEKIKNTISHRAKAMAALKDWFGQYGIPR